MSVTALQGLLPWRQADLRAVGLLARFLLTLAGQDHTMSWLVGGYRVGAAMGKRFWALAIWSVLAACAQAAPEQAVDAGVAAQDTLQGDAQGDAVADVAAGCSGKAPTGCCCQGDTRTDYVCTSGAWVCPAKYEPIAVCTDSTPYCSGPGLGDAGSLNDGSGADATADVAPQDTQDAQLGDTAGSDSTQQDAGGQDVLAADTGASACAGPPPAGTECKSGLWQCKPGFFKPYAKTDCLDATCENLAASVQGAIADVVAKAEECTSQDDGGCVHVATSTACHGTCGAAVDGGQVNDVLKVVGWLDDNLCKPFNYAEKCGYSSPKCLPPKPGCVLGKCAYSVP